MLEEGRREGVLLQGHGWSNGAVSVCVRCVGVSPPGGPLPLASLGGVIRRCNYCNPWLE